MSRLRALPASRAARIALLSCLTLGLPSLVGCASAAMQPAAPVVDPSRPTIALVRDNHGSPVLARWREQASSTVTFQRASDGARVEKSSSTRKEEEVLATNGDAATKVRVTYDEDKAVANGADAEQDSRAARTYLVERTNRGVIVTGGPDSGRDVERVKDDYRTLGDAEQILRNVLAQRLDVGDHVDAWTIAAAVRDYLTLAEGGRDYEVAEAAANFAGERDGAALFAVRLKLTRKLVDSQAGTRHLLEADLRGTLAVRASDARPLTLALEGPFTEFEGPTRRLEDGSVNLSDRVSRGTATFRMSRTYP